MFKAVIFDIDGTLVDSVDLHALAWEEAFRHFGFEVPFNDVRTQIGKGGDKLIPSMLREADAREAGEKLSKYRTLLFQKKYLPQVKPFAGVRELFEHIRQDGKKIVLGSSAKGSELDAYKKIAGITDLVEGETSADDAEESKPEPDIFQAALEKLEGIGADEVVVIGDTPYDVTAAKRAGIATIAVLCGGFPEEDLREAGAIAVYRDPSDLLAKYDSSPLAATGQRAA